MCSRHAEPGAGHPDSIEVKRCEACSEPARSNDTYCVGHARLMDYRVTDDENWAAND